MPKAGSRLKMIESSVSVQLAIIFVCYTDRHMKKISCIQAKCAIILLTMMTVIPGLATAVSHDASAADRDPHSASRGPADVKANAFLTVDGDHVRVAEDGGIVYDRDAEGSFTVTARSGWLVEGRETLTVPYSAERPRALKVTGLTGEDGTEVPVEPDDEEEPEEEEDYTLSIECDRYLGLDRTDSGRLGRTVKTATATLDPSCDGATVTWISCGSLCEFVEGGRVVTKPTGWTVSYRNKDPDTPSTEVDAEELVAEVTIPGKDGTIRASKRFTVVKVDVSVGGTGEDVEESTAKEVYYCKYTDDGSLSKFSITSMTPVKITCEPKDLPNTELVWLTLPDNFELFELGGSGTAKLAKSYYRGNEIGGKSFGLLRRPSSAEIAGGSAPKLNEGYVVAEHYASGAKDKAKVKAVMPPPLEITDVQFLSPNTKKKGAWPYDPVWDDDDWEATVNGTQAVRCSNDGDTAIVTYSLSRDVKGVEGEIYKKGGYFSADEAVFSLADMSTAEGVHTNEWLMPIRQAVGDYYAKIAATDNETGMERSAKSEDGRVRRMEYYWSEATDPQSPCAGIVVVSSGEEVASQVQHWTVRVAVIATATYVVGPWIEAAAAEIEAAAVESTLSGAQLAKIASWVAGTVIEEVIDWSVGGIDGFERAGTQRAFYSWYVTRYDWVGGDYIKYRKPNPNYNPDSNGQRPLIGPYKIPYFTPKFAMSVEMDRARDRNEDGGDKERMIYMSQEKGQDEGNENTKKWHWEPTPYEGGYGLNEPGLAPIQWKW